MNIVTYEPWSALRKLREEVDRLFQDAGYGLERSDSSNVVTSRWAPAVDIREEDDRFVLTADVPGVEPKDIEITMENGVLTIKGERKLEHEDSGENYRRIERAYGCFYRRFGLPDTADPDKIEAHGKDGVLEVTIPKKEAVQPKRIPVAA